jgi:DUF1680 family protein
MNVARLVASIGGYFVSSSDAGVAVHLYGGFSASPRIQGRRVTITETSDYPWSGEIRLTVDPETPTPFDLKLRIPGWARSATAAVNGEPVALAPVRGYATLSRRWSAGDVVTLHLPMPPERLYAHPDVRMDVGHVALRRGPLVYCVEEADNPGGPVQRLTLARGAALTAEPGAGVLGSATVLKAPAKRLAPSDGGGLYSSEPPASQDVVLTAVPYFLWANREPGSMQVWIAESAGHG